ncbi:putative Ubiquitin-conjugating BIR-domain enzyme [Paratrimastix pyriformis]|uniref:Ubiquitin-conjugating BIR-domain enzyme n=1 Tax=Paratrimastix pyriformis TaxID=342808 RepID=A0ABQ8UU88_9EUKA|nr:putative Ubiquitin-conjugating BIR-domain enzyme [Paratrimastix pyriformis]
MEPPQLSDESEFKKLFPELEEQKVREPPTSYKAEEPSASSSQPPNFWAKGTGYGSNLRPGAPGGGFSGLDRSRSETLELSLARAPFLERVASELEAPTASTILSNQAIRSRLLSVLNLMLSNDSLLDWGSQCHCYSALVKIVAAIVGSSSSRGLLDETPPPSPGIARKTVRELLATVANAARTFLVLHPPVDCQPAHSDPGLDPLRVTMPSIDLAKRLVELFDQIPPAPVPPSTAGETATLSAGQESKEERYIALMKAHAFRICDQGFAQPHAFAARLASSSTGPTRTSMLRFLACISSPAGASLIRILQDLAVIANSLPITYGSSIFCVADAHHAQLLKVLMTGPEGTPYANGAFEFAIYCEPSYPACPPKVQFMTTYDQTVRFGPNVYECLHHRHSAFLNTHLDRHATVPIRAAGTVCLSLLGTWSGGAGEVWSPTHSTLLQVLISIQSMILGAERPFFLEPGYEAQLGTDAGTRASNSYNRNIRTQTVRVAMLAELRKARMARSDFSSVILAHFKAKAPDVLHQLDEWTEQGMDLHQEEVDELRRALSGMADN